MDYSIKLRELVDVLVFDQERPVFQDVQINELACDSRLVVPGSLFFAYKGAASDGRDFMVQAEAAGAAAIVYESDGFDLACEFAIPVIPVVGLRHQVGLLADVFFKQPSAGLQVFGVTGTNGKTTCCYLLVQALNGLGNKANMIGTIGHGELGALDYSGLTTPDSIQLHRLLAHWRDQGVTQVCMEVSSHALDQGRVIGIQFFCVLFTNLSHDHLDYHGDMRSYGAAKTKLFTEFSSELAITNADDALGSTLTELANAGFTASYGEGGDVVVEQTHLSKRGMRLEIEANGVDFELETALIGQVNVPNILLLVTTLLALSIDVQEIIKVVSQLHAAPGRMELFSSKSMPSVVVDFAHTPDALEKALSSVRAHCDGKLWCVFGCGGDRDKTKRPLMGAAVNQYADKIIVTNDNPRTESPEQIAQDIVSAIDKQYQVILDRACAMQTAIQSAAELDWVLVAGRGHEPYQQIAGRSIVFSDRAQVKQMLGLGQ